jgi:hypothetical protein
MQAVCAKHQLSLRIERVKEIAVSSTGRILVVGNKTELCLFYGLVLKNN